MLKLHGLTIKNFMSIGNVTQSINFSDNDLVLVLGKGAEVIQIVGGKQIPWSDKEIIKEIIKDLDN